MELFGHIDGKIDIACADLNRVIGQKHAFCLPVIVCHHNLQAHGLGSLDGRHLEHTTSNYQQMFRTFYRHHLSLLEIKERAQHSLNDISNHEL